MRKIVKSFIEFYQPFRRAMVMVFGFIAVQQVLGMMGPWFLGRLIDGVVQKRSVAFMSITLGVMLAVYIFENIVVSYQRDRFELFNIDFPIPRYVSRVTNRKVFSLSISQLTNQNSGITQKIIENGQNSMTEMIYTLLYNVIPAAIRIVLLVGALTWTSIWLGTVAFIFILLYGGITFFMNIHVKRDIDKLRDMNNETGKYKSEALRNAGLVIANVQEHKINAEIDRKIGKASDFGQDMWNKFCLKASYRNCIIEIGHVAICAMSLWEIARGSYGIGQLAVVWSWSSGALGQTMTMGFIHRQVISQYSSVRKFFELIRVEPDVIAVDNPICPLQFKGEIEFRNVSMAYKTRKYIKNNEEMESEKESLPALKNLNLVIEAGETVAIVGESGAGKSTLVYALLRSQDPQEGQILIDGHDLRLLDPQHFRKAIGTVSQEITLSDHSLRYNLLFGLSEEEQKHISDEWIKGICALACIDKFVAKLEHGLDTVVGEKGIKIAGGERQRVGIARALMKNPSILIFDEATSNLDAKNEALVRKAIKNASAGRTIIIIAHRFSSIRGVDRIIVMNEGSVVSQGVHHDLIRNCPVYRELVQTQLEQLNWVM